MILKKYRNRNTTTNSHFAKAIISCLNDIEGLNPSFVHLVKFNDKNPHLTKAAKR
jgi:hypothetical protein